MAERVRVRRGNVIVTTTRPLPSDKIISRSPTPTEQRLQQSLPADLRNRPAEEVRAGQSLTGGQSIPDRNISSSRGSGSSRPIQQSIPSQNQTLATQRSSSNLRQIRLQALEKARAERQRLAKTRAGRIGRRGLDIVKTINRKTSIGEPRITAKQRKQTINIIENKNKRLDSILKNTKNPAGRKALKFLINKGNTQLKNAKESKTSRIIAGTFPIVPSAQIPNGVTSIVFVGKQRTQGNKVVTDIVFKTSRGQQGLARGVSVQKGKQSASVVLGRTGKVNVKFPSAKTKFTRVTSFVGRERTVSKPTKVTIKDTIKIGKNKKINIKKNLNALQQRGVGQVGTFRGKKVTRKFRGGQKKISKDEFATVSNVFTKGDISKIVGKTITRSKDRANFVGVIKGEKSASSLSLNSAQKQQYQKALEKVVGTTSSAVAKAEKRNLKLQDIKKAGLIKGLSVPSKTKTQLETPSRITTGPQSVPKTVTKTKTSPSIKTNSSTKTITKPKTKTKSKSSTTPNTRQSSRSTTLVKTAQKSKTKQKTKQDTLSRTKQRQSQKRRLVSRQRTVQRTKVRSARPFRIPRVIRPPILVGNKTKRKKQKTIVKKTTKGYNVYARPLKKKKGEKQPKLIKINKVPLTKSRAEDYRNYILDTSLARTGSIKPAKGIGRKGKLRVPVGYGKRTSVKFRTTRTVRKQRKSLKKGKVIEKNKRLLDTTQEKKGITLRRRLKQITPKKRRVKKRRK